MRRSAIAALVVLVVVLLVAPAVAIADDYDCYQCHDVSAVGGSDLKVDFAVAGVDYSACVKCHWDTASSLNHWHDPQPCRECHYTWTPYAAPDFSPVWGNSTIGYYAGPDSLEKSAAELHDIHVAGNWVDGFADPTLRYERCHAPSACSACHTGDVPHTDHAVSQYPAVSYRGATGAAVTVETLTCVNSACHPVSQGVPVPACTTCHEGAADAHTSVHDVSAELTGGCSNCHSTNLAIEHVSRGVACASCHMDDAYADAIASGFSACEDCHASPVHRQRPGRR
jgi:hypothetical protein